MKIVRTDYAGREVCQVLGCDEPAQPWGYVFDVDDVEILIGLCRRHEREFLPPPELATTEKEGA